MISKDRLDKILVSRGLVKSREIAKALIMEGKVFVDGRKITKAGTSVKDASQVSLKAEDFPYVSRGGLKIEAALHFFRINVQKKLIMDVGSSTGGFTDCLLKMGAQKVYCIDVGYGQLDLSLRRDHRVIPLERTNIRHLDAIMRDQKTRFSRPEFDDLMQQQIDMAVIDVSFISLIKVIPQVLKFLKDKGEVLALVKPQFEAGRQEIGKGGIIRDEYKRIPAVQNVREEMEKIGLQTAGIFRSPILGQKGNAEFFLYMRSGLHGRG